MSNVLTINGKKYIQSNQLAREFGYTTDYIGRLAREEKILATQVGRQWFVEPESLRVFSHQAQIEKEIRKEELRQRRKIEHLAHAKKETPVLQMKSSVLALAQLLLILSCGAFVGGLGFVVNSEGLGWSDLQQGSAAMVLLASEAFDPLPSDALYLLPGSVKNDAASDESSVSTSEATELRFADLPLFPVRTPVGTSSPDAVTAQFSDEVAVTTDAEGNQIVRPIFKDETESTERFLLVPVSGSAN